MADLHRIITLSWLGLALAVFVLLLFISAPYGRHGRAGWGPTVGNRSGWLIMEVPAVATMALCLLLATRAISGLALVFLAIWEFHYLYRAFVFPFLTTSKKRMPALVALMGAVTNIGIGWLNGWWLFQIGPDRGMDWLTDPRFIIGLLVFLAGFTIHVQSDRILRNLRKPGQTGYSIPRGGLYRWVSCPNYFGEIVQWCGWAVLTWSLPGLVFALWTVANLMPRAGTNHEWYQTTFEEYPGNRKALIPLIW